MFAVKGSQCLLLFAFRPLCLVHACAFLRTQSCGQTLHLKGQSKKIMGAVSCMGCNGTRHDHYLALLKSCSKMKDLHETKNVHADMYHHYVQPNGLLFDHLVLAYAKCGALDDSLHILFSLPSCSVFAWTAIVSGYVDCGQARDALEMFSLMQKNNVRPNKYTFVNLFKACSMIGDSNEARKAYYDWQRYGLDMDIHIGTTLISMYGKCRNIRDAENVFTGMAEHNIVSWNAMLSAYVDHGDGLKGLLLYRQMHEEALGSNQETFLIALQACDTLTGNNEAQVNKLKIIVSVIARALHADADKMGFNFDVYFASMLIVVYGKCECLPEAEQVFDCLVERNVVSWNVLLSAYVENHQGEKALTLYRRMKEEGAPSTRETFITAFQACSVVMENKAGCRGSHKQRQNHAFLDIGEALHADMLKSALVSDVFVVNTLIGMYGKCGNIPKAEFLFHGFPKRDTVTWNAMLSVYTIQGEGEKALLLYRQMQNDTVAPNQQTFVSTLKVCAALGNTQALEIGQLSNMPCLEIGRALHGNAKKKNLEMDMFIISSLISMYGKCGSIVEAENAFDSSPCVMACWNAMLSAYADQNQEVNALRFYGQLLHEGMSPSLLTFLIVVQACGILAEKMGLPDMVVSMRKEILSEIGKGFQIDVKGEGITMDAVLGNVFLGLYVKCEDILEVETLFDNLQNRDSLSWSVIMKAYVDKGQGEKALQLYLQMQQEGRTPSEHILATALQACHVLLENADGCSIGRRDKEVFLDIGKALHGDAQHMGLTTSLVVCNTLISFYGKLGRLLEAETLFDALPECDAASYCAMLAAYVESGEGDKALRFYKHFQNKISMLDCVAIACILQVCVLTGSLDVCTEIHFTCTFSDVDVVSFVANSLIRAYGSCAHLKDVWAIFDRLEQPDLVSLNACMAGYAQEGNGEISMRMYKEMQSVGLTPDRVTLLLVLSVCSHASRIQEGIALLDSMKKIYGIIPDLKHIAVMVELLGRAGNFTMLEAMLSQSALEPDLSLWISLLHACCGHGNLELGKQAFDHVMSINPNEPTAYVLLANICTGEF